MKNRIGFKRLYLGCDCMSPIQECPIPPQTQGGDSQLFRVGMLVGKISVEPKRYKFGHGSG